MTDNLRTQLSDYGVFHEERQGPVDIDSLFDPVTPIPPPTETRHTVSRGLLVAVAAGIAVILVIGLIPFLLRNEPTPQPAATTVPPTPSTSSTVATGLVGIGDGPTLDFVRISDNPGFDKFNTSEAVWFERNLYVVDISGVMYRSANGYTWEKVDTPDSPRVGAHPAVMSDGTRLVAIDLGRYSGASAVSCDLAGSAIASLDGETFTGSEIHDLGEVGTAGGPCYGFEGGGAAAGPAGILATRVVGNPGVTPATYLHVWVSQDGETWVRSDIPDEMLIHHDWYRPVAVDGGFLIAADPDYQSETNDLEIWFSEDGSTWESAGSYPAFESIHWFGGKVVTVGSGVRDLEGGDLVIPDVAIADMDLTFSEFGMVGVSTAEAQYAGTVEAVFSADGQTWARWPLDVNGTNPATVEVLGIGDGFVVLGQWYDHDWWIAQLPD